jgi:hypothetical protein
MATVQKCDKCKKETIINHPDMEKRTYLVKLTLLNMNSIQRDFCKDCFDTYIKGPMIDFYELLEVEGSNQ